jgi:hypothetical protein
MRHIALLAAGIMAVGLSGNAGALPAKKSNITESSQVQLVQEKRAERSDTIKSRVKRAWKDLTGYKFAVACPGFWMPINEGTCTESGRNREDARAKCEARHAFCQVRDMGNAPRSRRSTALSTSTMASR